MTSFASVGRLLVVEPDRLPVGALVDGAGRRLVLARAAAPEPRMGARLDHGADGVGDVVVARAGGARGHPRATRLATDDGEQTADRHLGDARLHGNRSRG